MRIEIGADQRAVEQRFAVRAHERWYFPERIGGYQFGRV
jgi:hypothetical protein